MDDRGAMETPNGLRVVAFTMRIQGYNLIREWATAGGHTIALIVATPGPSTRRNTLYHDVIAAAPPGQDILVTTRLRRVATPLLRELQPDLIICGGFPYRVLPEIVAIPRYGAVNFHPAPLPAYRGPNPPRMIYDEYPIVGMTLHRVEEEFDTGRILCQKTAPLPVGTTPEEIWGPWFSLVAGNDHGGHRTGRCGRPRYAAGREQGQLRRRVHRGGTLARLDGTSDYPAPQIRCSQRRWPRREGTHCRAGLRD